MADNENKATDRYQLEGETKYFYDFRHKIYGPAGLSRACGLFTVDIAEASAEETPTEPTEPKE